jgi:hypothetical protein
MATSKATISLCSPQELTCVETIAQTPELRDLLSTRADKLHDAICSAEEHLCGNYYFEEIFPLLVAIKGFS